MPSRNALSPPDDLRLRHQHNINRGLEAEAQYAPIAAKASMYAEPVRMLGMFGGPIGAGYAETKAQQIEQAGGGREGYNALAIGQQAALPVLGQVAGQLGSKAYSKLASLGERGSLTIRGYHGGPMEISGFDKAKIGTQTGEGWLGEGFYFSPHPDVAKSYGSKTTTADITLQNPFRFPEDVNPIKFVKQMGGPKPFTDWVKSQGYDGIISENTLHQIVAFEPNQITKVSPTTKAIEQIESKR